MTTINATNKQLELGFNGIVPQLNSAKREGRVARASWWFNKMRETVAAAVDWQAETQPRPEQIWISGTSREVKI